MNGLTQLQASLLGYLRTCAQTPSFEEMRTAIGLRSKSGIARLIEALEERGYVERIPNRARAIRVIETPMPWGIAGGELSEFPTPLLVAELARRGVAA